MKLKVKCFLIFLTLGCFVGAIVLMIVPYGVVMRWSAPPGETVPPSYHSYFDFLPYAYGHFFSPITAIVTAIATVFMILYIFLNKFRLTTLVLSLVALMCSLLALILPTNFNAISISITILLAMIVVLQIIHMVHKNRNRSLV